jgi:DNA-binding beta-propeller fold protein YncE
MATAGENGIICATEPSDAQFYCFIGSQLAIGPPPITTMAAGNQPWSLAMTTLGFGVTAETDAIVYARESTELRRYKVVNVNGTANITLQGSLLLTGITLRSQMPPVRGGWHLAPFKTGSASGKLAFLSEFDKKLAIIDIRTMTQTQSVLLPGIPFRIAADEGHGKVIVALADVPAGVTRFALVDVATGTVTNLTKTANLFAIGLAVSADGTKIYAAMRDKLEVVPNQ